MNLPNKLTCLRVILVPVFMGFAYAGLLTGDRVWYWAAAGIFAAASLTDMLDGRIARSRNLITDFGKFMDPLADKLLTTAAYVFMMLEGVCDPVALILILAREFFVSGLRMLAAGSKEKTVVPANVFGKVKTALMMVSICLFYFGVGLVGRADWLMLASGILCWLCTAAALISGWTYFRVLRHLLRDM